ncbi:MAG: ATP-binding protein, partial [Mycobacterium sp.]
VEAVRAGKLVYFIPLADLVAQLAKAEREGTLRERIRFLSRASLLVVDSCGVGSYVELLEFDGGFAWLPANLASGDST